MSFGIIGLGAALPSRIRTCDDAIYDPVRIQARADKAAELALFYGNREHRVLSEGQSLAELVAQAGREALADAHMPTGVVDRLYGTVSVSEYIAPAELYRVHELLGLREDLLTVPLQGEFTNFVLGLILAWEALRAGHCHHPLIAVGAGWSRNADYRLGNAYGLGDGAGAVLLGASEHRVIVDWISCSRGQQYRAMTMRQRPESGLDYPTFRLEPEAGMQTFLSLGMETAPRLVNELLARHHLTGNDITFIGHQASRKLMDHWNESIQPRVYLDTLEDYGNLLFASVPATLARYRRIETPYLVLYGIGIGSVADTAVLVRMKAA